MEHIIYRREILRSNCRRTRICDFEFGTLESRNRSRRSKTCAGRARNRTIQRPTTIAGGEQKRATHAMPLDRTGSPRNARIAVVSAGVASTGTPERGLEWGGRPPALGRREPVVSARLVRFRGEPFPPDRWTPLTCAAMRRTRTEHLSL